MKRKLLIVLAALVAVTSQAQHKYLGGDISLLPSYEKQGTVYKDFNGKTIELLPYLKQLGWNAIRVRLFVDPQNAPESHKGEGVCQDLDYVIEFSKQIKQAGLKLMLDFHYSDTWADPAKQFTPKRWENADIQQLADSVFAYTRTSLQTMRRAGVIPDMIQVGNEITNGMLWPSAHIDPTKDDRWDTLGKLLRAGSKACREICPKAQIIIHTEKAGDWNITQSYYEHLQQQQVDYDIIGLSYYPMWHGTIPNLGLTLDRLAERYPDKPVMMVEAAYYYLHDGKSWDGSEDFSQCPPGTIKGQREFTEQLVNELNRHDNVKGLFWWFPEENSYGTPYQGRGGLNRGLFNNADGCALPALYEMARFKR